MVGTILHQDSQLERILHDSTWLGLRFRAHADFDDFSQILWPQKFSEQRLRALRQSFINRRKPSGYSREYLSHPMAEQDAFFQAGDFIPMTEAEKKRPKSFYCGIDFAISTKESADFTVFVVAGMDSEGLLHIVDVRKGHWTSMEIVFEWFRIHARWKCEMYVAEAGTIEASIMPFLNQEMLRLGKFMNIVKGKHGGKDKRTRASSIQARMRAGGVRVDAEAEWYPGFEAELRAFDRGIHDDQVDALAWIGHKLDSILDSLTDDELEEEEYLDRIEERQLALREGRESLGRSSQTGY
jgi:predicted phage terminase large subunit-like protein